MRDTTIHAGHAIGELAHLQGRRCVAVAAERLAVNVCIPESLASSTPTLLLLQISLVSALSLSPKADQLQVSARARALAGRALTRRQCGTFSPPAIADRTERQICG